MKKTPGDEGWDLAELPVPLSIKEAAGILAAVLSVFGAVWGMMFL